MDTKLGLCGLRKQKRGVDKYCYKNATIEIDLSYDKTGIFIDASRFPKTFMNVTLWQVNNVTVFSLCLIVGKCIPEI